MPTRLFRGHQDFRELLILEQGLFSRMRDGGDEAGWPGTAERIEVDDWSGLDGLIAWEVEELEKMGYKEVDSDPVELSSGLICHLFGCRRLPARLSAFYDDEECYDLEEHYVTQIPGHHGVQFRADFCSPMLQMVYDVGPKVQEANRQRYVPLLMLDVGKASLEFFAVDVASPDCPVVVFSDDSPGFSPWRASLDEFLGELVDPLA